MKNQVKILTKKRKWFSDSYRFTIEALGDCKQEVYIYYHQTSGFAQYPIKFSMKSGDKANIKLPKSFSFLKEGDIVNFTTICTSKTCTQFPFFYEKS